MRSRKAHHAEVSRLENLIMNQFRLKNSTIVLVEEHWPVEPGFPPRMTVLSFWLNDIRHGVTIFKRLEDVNKNDLPPLWMRDRLEAFEPMGCSCC